MVLEFHDAKSLAGGLSAVGHNPLSDAFAYLLGTSLSLHTLRLHSSGLHSTFRTVVDILSRMKEFALFAKFG
jgi:hypothetical protein